MDKISDALSKKNTVINDIHVWKIATAHQAAILKVTSTEPLNSDEYENILKAFLPQLSHISIEICHG
jgi:Co/Zn/Cd efflux system component